VNGRPGRLALLVAALAAGLLLAVWAPPLRGAEPESRLRAQAATLADEEQAALLQLYAAESARADARSDLAALEARSNALAREESSARELSAVARRSLAASQRRVAATLRALYIAGPADPMAVILGATSLDEAVAGIESLSRATSQNRRLAARAREQAHRVQALRVRLADRRAALEVGAARARDAAARLERTVAAHQRTVAFVRARAGINEQRLAELEQRARAAQTASVAINIEPAAPRGAGGSTSSGDVSEVTPDSGAAEPGPGGSTLLVVDAVAYHLPGNTASGLPVGVGVIAVDPTVIPLGTRVLVPGYGPAVAADTGTAIKGNIIDLWMPSTAQALAWGRRTVTITVYG
jgi:peptidoglycan DL-endopeptidase CwlO